MTETFKLLELDRVLEICARQASSELGRRRVLDSVPSTEAEEVRHELTLVDEMVRLLSQTTLPLQGLSDISPTLRRITLPGSLLDRDQYLPLRDFLSVAGSLRNFFVKHGTSYSLLKTLSEGLDDFGALVAVIDKIFDPAGEIRDDASPELKRLRRQKEAEARRLHEALDAVLKKWSAQRLTQEDAPTYREGRLLIPVKSEHRSKISGVIQDESATGATIFVEPLETIVIGNAIRRLSGDEMREIHRLLLVLCDLIRAQLPEITAALEILTQFDHVYARARFARLLNGIPPEITAKPYLRLVEARHPLLALKSGVQVEPLTLTLGGEEGQILVITGPNAGGKTVAMKTAGLLCLMAACGLHVPAREGTTLPLLQSLHCDIGDPQSLDQDLSTFTSHVKRLKEALADERHPKMVLLDEIGASTDPAEGSALARAALLELLKQGSLAIVTTHQGTLKAFAHDTNGIFNGSMEFDQETLQPTFRFRPGFPGSSYALQISARAGLPEKILSVARTFLGEEKTRLEDLLARLNESLRQSEIARREAQLKRTEMESLRKLYSERLQELKATEKERLHKAAREAKELLEGVNRRIEAEVKAIREQAASKPVIVKAHQTVRSEKERVNALLKDNSGSSEPAPSVDEPEQPKFQPGDWVKMDDLREPVRVLALKKDGQEVMLEVGGLHLWITVDRLSPAKTPKSEESGPPVRISLTETPNGSYELDLRGMMGDEAAFTVEKYLDDCRISGWKSVRIIHGKGTGALRVRVREVLERYPGVKSFRYGRPEEGEFGVTVVELE
jgi:DNA mismatch repair protein MutS2